VLVIEPLISEESAIAELAETHGKRLREAKPGRLQALADPVENPPETRPKPFLHSLSTLFPEKRAKTGVAGKSPEMAFRRF